MKIEYFDFELPLTDKIACEEGAKRSLKLIKPEWNQDSIKFEIYTVGLTNKIFSAYIEQNDRVIFRVFGKNTEKIIDRKHELEAWHKLAKYGLAAPLYGQFKNGLICGYLPGRGLHLDDMKDPKIQKQIIVSMAKMHQIDSDSKNKKESCLFSKMQHFYEAFTESFDDKDAQQRFESHFSMEVLAMNMRDLQSEITILNENIGFCHNDLLVHNILYNEENKTASFIDYEYADTNYVLFDIGNHFQEYAGTDNPDYSLCPDDVAKRLFLKQYLEASKEQFTEERLEELVRRVNIFEAASHLFWSIWALVQSQNSTIDFDYLGYAIMRYNEFKKCLAKYEDFKSTD